MSKVFNNYWHYPYSGSGKKKINCFLIFICIYLAALGLSCGMEDL